MKAVAVFKLKGIPQGDSDFDPLFEKYRKVDDGTAKFHEWGVDFKNFSGGVGHFSTAIIERDDGSIENVPADCIKFI